MNCRLEQYVEEATARLESLPDVEREQEIREMRQHLDDLVAAHLELGEDEASATNAALAQFDAARDVATDLNVVNRWTRHKALPVAVETALFGAAILSVTVLVSSLASGLLLTVPWLTPKPSLGVILLGLLRACTVPLGVLAIGGILFRYGWRGALSRLSGGTVTGAACRFILLYAALTLVPRLVYLRLLPDPSRVVLIEIGVQSAGMLAAAVLTRQSAPQLAIRAIQIVTALCLVLSCLDSLARSLYGIGNGSQYAGRFLLMDLLLGAIGTGFCGAFALLGATLGTRGASRQQYTNKA